MSAETRRHPQTTIFSALAVASGVAALWFTWRRLFVGMDLQDESYYVLVPWRWVLGDRPFVQEHNLLQLPGLLMYPFVKVFGLVRHSDVTGLVLYGRHLYLLLAVLAAVVAFLLLRRLVRWQLALLAAAVVMTYIHWSTPQLSYNTMALFLLTISFALGAIVAVAGGGLWPAVGSGICLALAMVAYPPLALVAPFWALFFAAAGAPRVTGALAGRGAAMAPGEETTMRLAPWGALAAWAVGLAVVLVPVGLLLLSFGLDNLATTWRTTLAGTRQFGQLGGQNKAGAIVEAIIRLFSSRPYMLAFVVALLAAYLVYQRRPRVGRAALAFIPLALWLSTDRTFGLAAGYVIVYVLLVPYLFLFLPAARRRVGARLLLCVWAPALVAGLIASYTSSAGYLSAPVGFSASIFVSGLFLAWALLAVGEPPAMAGDAAAPDGGLRLPSGASWLALGVLLAVLAVTLAFQFQFQQRSLPYSALTSRFASGPWQGIKVTPERHLLMDTFARDLAAQTRPDDGLFIFFQGSGYYLYWKGAIAANGYWTWPDADGGLPQTTVDYYVENHVVPTLIVHFLDTTGMTDAEISAASGGFGYRPTLVRPSYAFLRKPAGESTDEVLARLTGD